MSLTKRCKMKMHEILKVIAMFFSAILEKCNNFR